MEESPQDKATANITLEADQSADDQNEVNYVNGHGWHFKNYHPNPNVRNNSHLYNYPKLDNPADNTQNNQGQNVGFQKGYNQNHLGKTYVLSQAQHNQFQNHKQLTNQEVTPAATIAPQDELKSLAMMMQQLLQGQEMQGKALNQVTTDINTRMNHMFNDLSTKYDNVASHMRQMDIKIAQTAESLKRQQAAKKGKQKETEQPPSDAPTADNEEEQPVEVNPSETEQPAEVVRPSPEPVPAREYVPKVPYPVTAKATRKD
ncbi:hypothetical protein F2Q69_00058879 [Brassica cretica]|uniref:Uncharacterized protein n=1 Tax=Brassica cretica TaxID=69181 RepID=A0A8S9RHH0_BRACR|nr:hypothetical protein F2Q69_00058879 [Brassica cretica]